MKNKIVKAMALAMTVATITMMGSASIYAADDAAETATEETADDTSEKTDAKDSTDEKADEAEDFKIGDLEVKNQSGLAVKSAELQKAKTDKKEDAEDTSKDSSAKEATEEATSMEEVVANSEETAE